MIVDSDFKSHVGRQTKEPDLAVYVERFLEDSVSSLALVCGCPLPSGEPAPGQCGVKWMKII